MKNKQADNIINKNKEQIYKIDNLIENEKNDIKNLNNIKNNFIEINKNVKRSIEILSKSVKSKSSSNLYNDMRNENRKILLKVSSIIENEELISKKNLNELYSKKEELEKENQKKQSTKE